MKKRPFEIVLPETVKDRLTVGQYRAHLADLVAAGRITQVQADARIGLAVDLELVNFAHRRLSNAQAFDFFGNGLGQQPAELAAKPQSAAPSPSSSARCALRHDCYGHALPAPACVQSAAPAACHPSPSAQ